MQIEVWSDVACPWCFLGTKRLEAALTEFEHADAVEVVYRSFELDPGAPRHGHELTAAALARKLGRSAEEVRQMQQQLIETAAAEGLEMRLHETVHTSTTDAHRLLHLALEDGGPRRQRALAKAFFAANFSRAEDIGDHEVLTSAAVEVGLEADRVAAVLASDEYADAVAADASRARAYGATGVPFFVVDQTYGISGAQSAEVFTRVLERAWDEGRQEA